MSASQTKDNYVNNKDCKDLSFIIETSGQIVPTTPDGNEFSLRQIRDYVAGPPELLCQTNDGFFLFHNKEAKAWGLPANPLATAMYRRLPQADSLLGRVFAAHPDHIAAYLKVV